MLKFFCGSILDSVIFFFITETMLSRREKRKITFVIFKIVFNPFNSIDIFIIYVVYKNETNFLENIEGMTIS